MRKILFLLLFFIIILSINNISKDNEIRVRVIPNSDEESDILLKEKVKNYVILYLKNAYSSDYKQFVLNVNETMNEFNKILNKELEIDCTITFDNHTLYNKTYNGNAVINKETLLFCVVIGEVKGSNWWGTVYPEFLNISSSDELKYESLIVNLFKR